MAISPSIEGGKKSRMLKASMRERPFWLDRLLLRRGYLCCLPRFWACLLFAQVLKRFKTTWEWATSQSKKSSVLSSTLLDPGSTGLARLALAALDRAVLNKVRYQTLGSLVFSPNLAYSCLLLYLASHEARDAALATGLFASKKVANARAVIGPLAGRWSLATTLH